MRAPITYVHDNLVFGAGRDDAWAVYSLAGVSYPHLAHTAKLELFARVEALLYRLESDVQLLRVSRAFSLDAYAGGVRAAADPRHRREPLLDAQLAHDRRALAGRASTCPELYLAVALAPAATGLAARTAAFGLRSARTLSERALRAVQAAERRVFERVDAYVEVERASTEQIQWLVRRAYARGLGEPPVDARHRPQALALLDGDGDRAWRPARVDVHRWHDALLERGVRTLRAHTEAGVSHQAQLVLGALPEESRFPGDSELLFAPLERLPFAVDACLHARWLPNRDAVALARRRRADAEVFYEEEASGYAAPSAEALERPAAARELEHRLTRPERPPLLRAAIVLSLGAPDEAALAERVERTRIEYGTVALHRPHGEQHRLFLSTLPAQRNPLDDYAEYLLLEQVAALMPLAVDAAGSELGPYLGHTLSAARRPVCLDLANACASARAPTVLLLGTLGSGKTLAMLSLAYRAWTLGSGPIVDLDPKGDHDWASLPGVRTDGPDADLELVELSAADAHRGLLDPLRIGEPGAREDLTYGFLSAILPAPVPPDWQTELRLAVQLAASADARSCAAVLDQLRAGPPAAQACARALAVHAGSGLARLGFADPDRPPPEVGTRDIVCLRIRHLRLPPPGRARGELDEEERIGAALLRLLAAYALRLTATDPDRHSVVCVDEAWALLEHAPEVLERLSRLGRSQNVTPLLASQLVGDVDALDGLVGTCLVFGLDSDAEATAALRLLRQDPGDELLRRRLLGFRRGRGLLLDADGRLTALQVEITDPALLAALDTTPGARAPSPAAGARVPPRLRPGRAGPTRPPHSPPMRPSRAPRKRPRPPRRRRPPHRWTPSRWRRPRPPRTRARPAPPRRRRPRARGAVVLAAACALLMPAAAAAAPAAGAPRDPLSLRSPLCAPATRAALPASQRRACERTGSPLSGTATVNYAYDIHYDPGLTNVGGVVQRNLHELLDGLWVALLFVVRGALTLLDWAFAINPFDLDGTGELTRALGRFGAVIDAGYLSAVIAALGLWGIWTAFIRQRTAETLGGLAAAVAMLAAALAVIHAPGQTAGLVARTADQAAMGLLAAPTHGVSATPVGSYADAVDGLFDDLVRSPWCALQFRTQAFCRGAAEPAAIRAALDAADDGTVAPAPAGQRLSRAELWLAFPPASKSRDALHDYYAGHDGGRIGAFGQTILNTPLGDSDGTNPDELILQGADGMLLRLPLLAVIVAGLLGALCVLGWVLRRLLDQALSGVVLLLLTPLMMVMVAFGAAGRAAFARWALALLGALVSKAVYAAILGVLVLAARLIASTADGSGADWLLAWLLQSAFWWSIFLRRRELVAHLSVVPSFDGARPRRGLATLLALRTVAGAMPGVGRSAGPLAAAQGARLRSRVAGSEATRAAAREHLDNRVAQRSAQHGRDADSVLARDASLRGALDALTLGPRAASPGAAPLRPAQALADTAMPTPPATPDTNGALTTSPPSAGLPTDRATTGATTTGRPLPDTRPATSERERPGRPPADRAQPGSEQTAAALSAERAALAPRVAAARERVQQRPRDERERRREQHDQLRRELDLPAHDPSHAWRMGLSPDELIQLRADQPATHAAHVRTIGEQLTADRTVLRALPSDPRTPPQPTLERTAAAALDPDRLRALRAAEKARLRHDRAVRRHLYR